MNLNAGTPHDFHVLGHQLAMKEKMLMKLERDRVKAKNEAIEAQIKAMQARNNHSCVCIVI